MFSGSIPHLVSGVSRQVDAVRLITHVQEQVNRFSAPSTGNQRRSSLEHIAKLPGTFSGEYFYHPINRDEVERYHVLINNGDLRVFTNGGVERTVSFPDGKAYLNAASPNAMFSAATSADFTFIANNTVTVAMDEATRSPTRGVEALLFVRSANFNKAFKVFIDGTLAASYTTPDGVDDSRDFQRFEQEAVTPVNIAKTLFWGSVVNINGVVQQATSLNNGVEVFTPVLADINGWDRFTADGSRFADISGDNRATESIIETRLIDNLPFADWDVARFANVLHIKRKNGAAFSIRVETDRVGDKDSILAVMDSIQDFNELPNHGPEGFVVKVAGVPTDGFDDYFVRIEKPNGNDDNDSIVWRECPKPDIPIAFNAATMPHVLVRESDGNFTFKKTTWVQRKAGDEDDDPSFIGGKINDVVFNRARLAFLSTESVVTTRSEEFFDFWRTTKTAVLDDDPIDVAGTSDNVSIFRHAVSYDEDLYLFSGLTVHRLTAGDILSPKNVALPTAVTAQVNLRCPPVATSKSVLFLGSGQSFGDIREVYTAPDSEETINGSVSDHVPGFLPTNITSIINSDSSNIAVAFSQDVDAGIFVYQYFWSGQEKLQTAWHKWTLPSSSEVIGATFFDDQLNLVIRRGTTVFVEKINCAATLLDDGFTWHIRLDRRVKSTALTPVVNGDNSVFTLPYDPTGIDVRRFNGTDFGLPVDFTVDGNEVTVPTASLPVVFGFPFGSRLEFSRFYMRDNSSGRSEMLQTAPFRLRRIFLHVDNTAFAKAFVQPFLDGPIFSKEYTSLTSNDAAFDPNKVILGKGFFSLPIKARSDRCKIFVENNTVLPDCYTGVEWEGEYDIRAKRV
jgi:hypothetical protein